MTAPDYAALAREAVKRRQMLGLSQEDIARRSGLGVATVRRMEGRTSANGGHDMRAPTARRLEVALQWPRGLVDRILGGLATRDELEAPAESQPPKGATGASTDAPVRTGLGEVATITLAAELIDRLAWHEQVPAVQAAIHTLLAAMPALVGNHGDRSGR